jgi:ABC-2 type transport system ATP-binding protein
MNALEVIDVSHRFGRNEILRSVSFRVPEGRFVALVGPNGAGKTTLFSLITRLYYPRGGTILVFGNEVKRQPVSALSAMGIVFQMSTLDLDLSVRANLLYHCSLHNIASALAKERVGEELGRLGVADLSHRRARDLSGGERRRVEIARALLHRPRLLLADEPTSGLDPQARHDLLLHVHAIARERGVAVLWATHIGDELAAADEVIALDHGRRVERRSGELGTVDAGPGDWAAGSGA